MARLERGDKYGFPWHKYWNKATNTGNKATNTGNKATNTGNKATNRNFGCEWLQRYPLGTFFPPSKMAEIRPKVYLDKPVIPKYVAVAQFHKGQNYFARD